MIRVLHIRDSVDRNVMADLMCAYAKDEMISLSSKAYAAGLYEHVANVKGNDLDIAYRLTNNIDNSWSLDETFGLEAIEPRAVIVRGQRYGRKSTSMGDLMILEGKVFVVAALGFLLIGEDDGKWIK